MIVLDTNVLSALMRREPEPAVIAWLDVQPSESVWTTSISLFEVQFGLNVLAIGRRREALQTALDLAVQQDMGGRVLDFDAPAAVHAAEVAAKLRSLGKPVDFRDVQIAGIVGARRATLATRNTRHFVETGIPLVNPWGDASA